MAANINSWEIVFNLHDGGKSDAVRIDTKPAGMNRAEVAVWCEREIGLRETYESVNSITPTPLKRSGRGWNASRGSVEI